MSDPFDALKERRNVSTDDLSAMFTAHTAADERAALRRRAREKAWRLDRERPPSVDELQGIPKGKHHSPIKWHEGGGELCPAPGEKVSIWYGPYAAQEVTVGPGVELIERGYWVPREAHKHDWSKPCLYRIIYKMEAHNG